MKTQTVHGKYTDAVIYTVDNPEIAVEKYALAQVQMICDHEASAGSRICIMPDVHPGKVGPIGLTMVGSERLLPNLLGIDIGCGMTLAKLGRPRLELSKLDAVIHEYIPTGFALHASARSIFHFDDMYCASHLRQEQALCSLGTLGGGNHFIEVDRSEDGELYITIHSGSRHLGKEVSEYYIREGQRILRERGLSEPYEMTWIDGDLMQQYIHDVGCAEMFARLNRETMLKIILKRMKWKASDIISSSHNMLEVQENGFILRKGAASARAGEDVVIPIHMKDGVMLGKGLGNSAWNYSAPHGSGRLYKREDVQKLFSVSAYKKSMDGIYSSCVNRATLDESPFCYRNLEDIQNAVSDTVSIERILKPVYNYKDCQGR